MDDLAKFMGYGVIYCIDAFGLFALIAIPLILISKSRPTKDAPDLGESSASDSESKPASKWVI